MLNFQDHGPRHIAGCTHMNSNSTSHISELPAGVDMGSGAVLLKLMKAFIRTMIAN